ncbi:MAG: TIGR03758 family integrating conjugative element protein [Actinomycetaceae bacterium]|nr:TIGR03758 family integrating conjugative element protein [Actinomycetaceae bacterium]
MNLTMLSSLPLPRAMSSAMSSAFQAGSGVDPGTLRTVIFAICAGVALTICTWVAVKLLHALGDGDITSSEALRGIVSTCILAGVLLWVVS